MNKLGNEDFLPEIYNLAYHNNVCHVCKETEGLKRCSLCKTVAYCSKGHQKIDWRVHKNFCKAIFNVKHKFGLIKIDNFEDFLWVKKLTYKSLEQDLGRKLTSCETKMWMHQRYCEVCFSEKVHLDCPNCKNVFFCSEDHRHMFKEQHIQYCSELKLCMELSLFRSDLGNTDIIASDIPSDVQNLPNTILDLLQLYDKNFRSLHLTQNLLKIQCLSPAASILYSLEKCGILQKRSYKNQLIIHIVGGNLYEIGLLWKEMFELTFHWITNLTNLEYFIIGPELNHNGSTDKFTKQVCNSCKNRNVVTRCTFHTQLYHNIANILKKPDIIVCFNSGIHMNANKYEDLNEVPEHQWKDSIEYLIKDNVPLILTAYTFNEIVSDIKEIQKKAKNKIRVLVEPQINPFSDRKPARDFESQKVPIFYVNGFISVLIKL